MIYRLPTRSPRKYRGKYPYRINSWSTGGSKISPDQQIVKDHLGLETRPVHLELNNGERYIADAKSIGFEKLRCCIDLLSVVVGASSPIELSQESYDAMLAKVREVRGHAQV